MKIKKMLAVLAGALVIAEPGFAAAPQQVLYQGTLRKSGTIYTGNSTFVFRVTSADGLTQYWTSGSTVVAVNQGLFRYPLGVQNTGTDDGTFAAIPWAAINPYIETTVDGTTLLPREQIASVPYALFNLNIANVNKTGDSMTGQLTMAGSSITIVNPTTTDSFSLAVTTAVNRSIYQMVVTTYGYVGVGITNPREKLHIQGGNVTIGTHPHAYAPGDLAATENLLVDGNVVIDGKFISHNATGSSVTFTNAGDFIVGTSTLDVTQGNVGIGTTSPASKLHLSSGTLTIDGNAANSIIASGNVGVGTTNPAQTLDINGTAQFGSTAKSTFTTAGALTMGAAVTFAPDNTYAIGGGPATTRPSAVYSGYMMTGDGLVGAPSYRFNGGNYGIYRPRGLGITDGTNQVAEFFNRGLGIGTVGNDMQAVLHVVSTGTTATSPVIKVDSAYGTELFRVQYNGNVGVGTTNPGRTLEVAGNVGIKVNANSGGNSQIAFAQGGTDKAYLTYWNGSGTLALTSGSGTDGVQFSPTTGNVGIGTTSPGALLSVGTASSAPDYGGTASQKRAVIGYSSGNTTVGADDGFVIRNENTTTGNITGLHFATGSGAASGVAQNVITASIVAVNGARTANQYSAGDLAFLTSPGSNAQDAERVRITGAGNVGIGTTGPNTLLNIKKASADPIANTYTGMLTLDTSDAKTSLQIGVANTWNGSWIQSMNEPATGGGNFALALNPLGGNVGIGVVTPKSLLDVNGASTVRGAETVTSSVTVNGTAATDFSVKTSSSVQIASPGVLSIGFAVHTKAASNNQFQLCACGAGLVALSGSCKGGASNLINSYLAIDTADGTALGTIVPDATSIAHSWSCGWAAADVSNQCSVTCARLAN